MRHRMAHRKLGRTSSHRAAMFRNQLASMIDKERIITTLVKAKELRPLIEKMVTLGRNDSVPARRQAAQSLSDNGIVQKLFNTLAPRFTDRPGGYTRIIKLGPRRGDGAEMAILEFVDYTPATGDSGASKAGSKKGAAKKSPAADAADEKPKKKSKAKAPDEDDTLVQKKPRKSKAAKDKEAE